MRLTIFLIFALFISLLLFSASHDVLSDNGEYINYNQVAMRFQDTNAVISVSYDLDVFSNMYVFLLGTHNLESSINDFFFDFEDIDVIEISNDRAVILARNVSRINDEHYLHDSREFGGNAGMLVMIFPDGSTSTYSGTNLTENAFWPR